MIRMALYGLLLGSISGCVSPESGIKKVDCTGIYSTNLGSAHERRVAVISVKEIRVDKNGTIWIRPENTLNIHFLPGWKYRDTLSDYQCTGDDYGLRGETL